MTKKSEDERFTKAKDFVTKTLRERLPQDLLFHCADHTLRDVLPAAEALARKEGIAGDDLLCLRVAALFHDIGYVEQYSKNEAVGCAWAEKHLPTFGFSKEQIEKTCAIIMATQMPQKPSGILEEIICDADLSHLGSEEFFSRTELLRREVGIHSDPAPKEIAKRDWAAGNVKFIESHVWWTRSAREMWSAMQSKNLQKTRAIAEGTTPPD